MRYLFIFTALLFSANAQAEGEALAKDLGIQGAFRYCRYSDGRVIGFDSAQACPARAPKVQEAGKGTGMLMRTQMETSSKLCIYRVGGVDKDIRIGLNDTCPLNQEF